MNIAVDKGAPSATHEIVIMNQSDAEELINFAGMLLKFIYEYPIKARPHVHKET